jgi:hypothetical protein
MAYTLKDNVDDDDDDDDDSIWMVRDGYKIMKAIIHLQIGS